MIVTFKSKAASDVIMFGEAAHQLMHIMGKAADPQGIITVEQLPAAMAALQAAMAKEKVTHQADDDDETPAIARGVSLTQRALPLLELMTRSHKKNTPVVWGV